MDETVRPRVTHVSAVPQVIPAHGAATRRDYRRLYLNMAATDCLCVVVAFGLSHLAWRDPGTPSSRTALWVLPPLLTVGVFLALGLYRVHRISTAEEFRRIVMAVTLVVTTTAAATAAIITTASLALPWFLTILLVSISRRVWHWRTRRARDRGWLRFRTVVVGADEEAARLAERMADATSIFDVIGHVAGQGRGGVGPAALTSDDLPILGDVEQLRSLVREQQIECVVVQSNALSQRDVEKALKLRRLEGVEVWVTVNFPECMSTRVAVKPVGGFMALSVDRIQLSGLQAAVKRTLDLVLSTIGLILSAPLWLATALAIKLTSPGPVLYRQQRLGRRRQPFTLYKFRTMVVGAELLLGDLHGRNEANGPLFKVRDDPRVTPLGGWLRRWSLDELPQLLNVVKGQMSMVGPRPPLPGEVEAYEEWQLDRLEVPPGLTGLWQVSGRSELTFEEYVRLDLYYIENWSLAYDLFIIAKTIPMVLSKRGAC